MLKRIAEWEYEDFVRTLSGPAGFLVYDGDYDRGIAWPDGKACEAFDFTLILLGYRYVGQAPVGSLLNSFVSRVNELRALLNYNN